jgi:outer membrane protein
MKQNILLSFVLLFICFTAKSQENTRLSLDEAVNYALQNSLSVQNANLESLDADQQIKERLSIGLPKLSASLGYNYYLDIPTSILPPFFPESDIAFAQNSNVAGQPIPIQVTRLDANGEPVFGAAQEIQFGLKHNATAGINLESLLFDWTYLTGVRAAREFKNYKKEELKVVERSVRNQVIDAYLPSLILRENISILDSNLMNLKRLKFETNESYKAGFVEQLDVDRLTLSIANLEVSREAIIRQQETVENSLKLAMNMSPESDITLTDNIDNLLSEISAEDLTGAIDMSKRPELGVIDKGIELADLNIEVNKAGYYPSLSGFFNYQQQYQGNTLADGNWFPVSLIGLQANIPIYSGGFRKTQVERAKILKETNMLQKKQFENGTTMEIQTARINYLSAKDRLANQQENVDLAKRIYNTTKIKYKEGVGSSIEITSAEQQLYQTQQSYTTALYDLLVAKFALEKAIGK